MLLAVDVQYDNENNTAQAAGVLFESWDSQDITLEILTHVPHVEPYVPGQFYRRELPCIQAVLAQLPRLPETIIVDGYVDLGFSPGLGRYVWNATAMRSRVVGVAKTRFRTADAVEVLRGQSRKPLYVTAAGTPLAWAVEGVQSMYGEYRFPELLKRVDHLARGRK